MTNGQKGGVYRHYFDYSAYPDPDYEYPTESPRTYNRGYNRPYYQSNNRPAINDIGYTNDQLLDDTINPKMSPLDMHRKIKKKTRAASRRRLWKLNDNDY